MVSFRLVIMLEGCVTSYGRYSTGSNLNTYSALIQNFYSQETSPHQAVHVAVNTGVQEGEQAGVKAYVRYPCRIRPVTRT